MLDTLFPYQDTGAAWLAKMPHALLADEMGLGKSAQVVRACDIINAFDILVVCPAVARVNWEREFHKFSPLDRPSNVIAEGKGSPRRGVNIISYDLVGGNEKMKHALMERKWDVLVADEAHLCKERTAKRTRAIYGHAKKLGIVHSAKFMWRLTGTPMLNNASDLYTHLKSAGIECRPYWDFVFDFCDGFTDYRGEYKITGVKNALKLKAMLAQFMLRRTKEEVMLDLPPIVFSTVTVERSEVELDPWFLENWHEIGIPRFLENMKNKDATVKQGMELVKEGHHYNAEDSLRVLETYSKSTATLRRYIGLAKMPRIVEILKAELDSGAVKKLVIFAIHQQVIDQTRELLKEYHPVTLYGGTPDKQRQKNIDRFQNDKACKVFIGQIIAAGTAITLTNAHEVVFMEADWVPANNAQAAMRCHRIGQKRAVRVRFFSCAGSVDEEITRVLTVKTREIAKILD